MFWAPSLASATGTLLLKWPFLHFVPHLSPTSLPLALLVHNYQKPCQSWGSQEIHAVRPKLSVPGFCWLNLWVMLLISSVKVYLATALAPFPEHAVWIGQDFPDHQMLVSFSLIITFQFTSLMLYFFMSIKKKWPLSSPLWKSPQLHFFLQ